MCRPLACLLAMLRGKENSSFTSLTPRACNNFSTLSLNKFRSLIPALPWGSLSVWFVTRASFIWSQWSLSVWPGLQIILACRLIFFVFLLQMLGVTKSSKAAFILLTNVRCEEIRYGSGAFHLSLRDPRNEDCRRLEMVTEIDPNRVHALLPICWIPVFCRPSTRWTAGLRFLAPGHRMKRAWCLTLYHTAKGPHSHVSSLSGTN